MTIFGDYLRIYKDSDGNPLIFVANNKAVIGIGYDQMIAGEWSASIDTPDTNIACDWGVYVLCMQWMGNLAGSCMISGWDESNYMYVIARSKCLKSCFNITEWDESISSCSPEISGVFNYPNCIGEDNNTKINFLSGCTALGWWDGNIAFVDGFYQCPMDAFNIVLNIISTRQGFIDSGGDKTKFDAQYCEPCGWSYDAEDYYGGDASSDSPVNKETPENCKCSGTINFSGSWTFTVTNPWTLHGMSAPTQDNCSSCTGEQDLYYYYNTQDGYYYKRCATSYPGRPDVLFSISKSWAGLEGVLCSVSASNLIPQNVVWLKVTQGDGGKCTQKQVRVPQNPLSVHSVECTDLTCQRCLDLAESSIQWKCAEDNNYFVSKTVLIGRSSEGLSVYCKYTAPKTPPDTLGDVEVSRLIGEASGGDYCGTWSSRTPVDDCTPCGNCETQFYQVTDEQWGITTSEGDFTIIAMDTDGLIRCDKVSCDKKYIYYYQPNPNTQPHTTAYLCTDKTLEEITIYRWLPSTEIVVSSSNTTGFMGTQSCIYQTPEGLVYETGQTATIQSTSKGKSYDPESGTWVTSTINCDNFTATAPSLDLNTLTCETCIYQWTSEYSASTGWSDPTQLEKVCDSADNYTNGWITDPENPCKNIYTLISATRCDDTDICDWPDPPDKPTGIPADCPCGVPATGEYYVVRRSYWDQNEGEGCTGTFLGYEYFTASSISTSCRTHGGHCSEKDEIYSGPFSSGYATCLINNPTNGLCKAGGAGLCPGSWQDGAGKWICVGCCN